ncbi:hypothetical protein CHUAL_005602 [Chamberlinius hualienensis]
MKVALGIFAVFLGCSGNAVFLELLTRYDPGSGALITFAQFLIISVIGFVFTTKFGTVQRKVPIKQYVILVTLFYLANITNNYALKFDISMPLHMIFRSGSLITNMFLGVILLKRKYTLIKYVSVIMITVGISICTIVSTDQATSQHTNSEGETSYAKMSIGILLLSIALLLSSWLGIRQETLFVKFGKHPDEAVYYSHLLPIPGFLVFYKDIVRHFQVLAKSDLIPIPFTGIVAPELLLYLLGNVATQYPLIFFCFQVYISHVK